MGQVGHLNRLSRSFRSRETQAWHTTWPHLRIWGTCPISREIGQTKIGWNWYTEGTSMMSTRGQGGWFNNGQLLVFKSGKSRDQDSRERCPKSSVVSRAWMMGKWNNLSHSWCINWGWQRSWSVVVEILCCRVLGHWIKILSCIIDLIWDR